MLYYFDRLDGIDDALLEEFSRYAGAQRRTQAERYRFRKDRLQSVMAFLLLRVALFLEYGETALPLLEQAEGGKPRLLSPPQVYFNLSHCKLAVACALSTAEVGVDIQDYEPFNERTARYFMSEEELAHAEKTPEYFTRLWALKESIGKCQGVGIGYKMSALTVQEGVWMNGMISRSWQLDGCVLALTEQQPTEQQTIPQHIDLQTVRTVLGDLDII